MRGSRKSALYLCDLSPFPNLSPVTHAQVLKIGSLKKSMTFFENVLGLKVLRHEEFDEGCEATCNGPYGGEYNAVFRMIQAAAVDGLLLAKSWLCEPA